MTQELTYQELRELQEFYRSIDEEDKARDIEVYIDHKLDAATEQQASALEELNNFGGGPRE